MRMILSVPSVALGHAQLRPLGELAVFAVDVGQFFDRDGVQRVSLVDVDGQGVVADDDLLGLGAAVGFGAASISSFFILRLVLAMSQLPSIRLAMPTPEPPPSTWTLTSGCLCVILFGPGLRRC